jgi:hypothetical protein
VRTVLLLLYAEAAAKCAIDELSIDALLQLVWLVLR